MGLYICRDPLYDELPDTPQGTIYFKLCQKLGSHPTAFAVNATEFGCIVPDFMLVIWIVIEPV